MKILHSVKWLKALLVVLFVSYYVGGTAFTHTHHFLNYTITHSHPYWPGTDGLPHHDHSTVAFNTIEELDAMCMELAPHLSLIAVWVLLSILTVLPGEGIVARMTRCANLRAPPCLVY